MTLTISEPKGVQSIAKLNVWETGYKVCLDVFRLADEMKDDVTSEQLKHLTIPIIFDLSKRGGKVSRSQVKRMKQMYMQVQRLTTLMMFVRDLDYLNDGKFMEVNSNLNYFSVKLKKIIKYNERKLKNSK